VARNNWDKVRRQRKARTPLDEDERVEIELERWSSRADRARVSTPGRYRVRRIPPGTAPPDGADVATRVSLSYALRTSTARVEAIRLVVWVIAEDDHIETTSARDMRVEDVVAWLPQLTHDERSRLLSDLPCDGDTSLSRMSEMQRKAFASALLTLRYRPK
jgi:hypothetical protein